MCSDRFGPSVVVLNDRTLSLSQTTAVLTSGLERIPDQLGYLVISEDGVLAVSVRCVLTGSHRGHVTHSRHLLIGFLKSSISHWRTVPGPAHRLTCASVCR